MTDSHILRMFDAAANRASEGLRVVEDFVRFVLDDGYLTGQFKALRHDLAAALKCVDASARGAARETQQDVGTDISTLAEQQRDGLEGLLAANVARSQQALRSLEETAKLLDGQLAVQLESLRYRSYVLAAALVTTRKGIQRLDRVRVYVLIDGCESLSALSILAQSLVTAKVGAIQLRDKRLCDRDMLERARCLRELTAGQGTLFIVNDRPDIASLSNADGVHVGQDELSVKDVRSIVGVDRLIGVSTHDLQQARQAVLDGANYIGVGPTFPSPTKVFEQYTGVRLLKDVADDLKIPAFAIGGIGPENILEVIDSGISRVAVSSAVTGASDPAEAARHLMRMLDQPQDKSIV